MTSGVSHRQGSLRLRVDSVLGVSSVTSAFSRQPARLLVPVPRGPCVWAIMSSFGGGLVAGDAIELSLSLGPGARCYVGSQASTKVYRSIAGRQSSHTTEALLGPDSVLIFAPDPVQPFADADYSQSQKFVLEAGAGLVVVDSMSAGRTARGERWAFRRFHSRNEVFCGKDRVLLDVMNLQPEEGPLAAEPRMGRYNSLAWLALIGTPLQRHAEAILAHIEQLPVGRRTPCVASASRIRNGIIVRIGATEPESARQCLRLNLEFLKEFLPDNPWDRKG